MARRRSMLAALAVMVLGYIGVFFGRLLQAAVSRHRERLADASAVQFTRNPAGLDGRAAQDRRRQRRLAAGRRPKPKKWRTCCSPRACRVCSPRILRSKSGCRRSIRRFAPASCRRCRGRSGARLRASARRRYRTSVPGTPRAGRARRRAQSRVPLTAACQRSRGARHRGAGRHHRQRTRALCRERLRASIPEPLRDFVDSADHARALMLVVLASKVPEVQAAQRRILEARVRA